MTPTASRGRGDRLDPGIGVDGIDRRMFGLAEGSRSMSVSAPPRIDRAMHLPKFCLRFLVVVVAAWISEPHAAGAESIPVRIVVDAGVRLGPLEPIWRFFGADEPNYATMKDGRRLLGQLGQLGSTSGGPQVYFRTHNLLTSGDGTPALKWGSTGVYREEAGGQPTYDWTVVDRIFDTYLARNVRPYAQIGFMPEALSRNPQPYQHEWRPGLPYDEIYTGWAQPPKDWARWAELVHQWVRHCVARYGASEVARWYWETWNEANIGYWKGTPEEFHRLHDLAIDAVRRALPNARVGGPDSAGHGGDWMRRFLDHCLRGTNYATGRVGTPLDFISFHAKGAPVYTNGHVRMGIAAHLREIDRGFRLVASYPELKQTPIVIGESDPEGCAACQGPSLAYRNGTMYSSYTAATFARIHDLAARHGVRLEGALTWAFEFEDQPYFAGFRALSSNGIDLPVLNVFRMLRKLEGERIGVTSDRLVALGDIVERGVRAEPDIGAIAVRSGTSTASDGVTVLVWHYHDDDQPGAEARVEVVVQQAGFTTRPGIRHLQIDAEHSNAYQAWLRMGSPLAPRRAQYDELRAAGQLATLPNAGDRLESGRVSGGDCRYTFVLPRQGVALLEFKFAAGE